MNPFIPPLLAKGWQDLVSVLVGLAFLVIWVLSQIGDAKKKLAGQAGPRPGMQPQPPQPRGIPGAGQQADPLRAQVDEFLRRAGQQRQAEGAPANAPAGRADPRRAVAGREGIEVLLGDEPAQPERRPLAEPLRPMSGEPAPSRRVAEPRPQKPRPPRRVAAPHPQTVAEHVAEHVGAATQQIRAEVSHLGERVIQADEQFDVQLQQKFDHQLGSLANRRAERIFEQQEVVGPASPALQIAAMLANPDGVRQAIVVNEILRRPEDRWQ